MIVLISGGLDPVHNGHLDYIEAAAEYGKVIVALNSDAWLMRKKGYVFMPWDIRSRIVNALEPVYKVIRAADHDGTVCNVLRLIKPDYFANGGDRVEANLKEHAVCQELGIVELFNVGGGKVNSSSDIIRDYHQNAL